MKITKKQLFSSIAFLVILGGVLTALSIFVFVPIEVTNAFSSFYMEEEDSLDLTLIGNSTVMYGFSPSVAYGERNVTSHVIGSQPSHPEVTNLAIVEAYETQHPSAIFVDVNGLTFQTRNQQEYFVRNFYDSMPEGPRKDAVAEKYPYLLSESEKTFELFPNHNNFRNYEALIEFDGSQKLLKGHKPMSGVAALGEIPTIDPEKTLPLNEDQTYYVDEFIKSAKKCVGTKVVFGRMPRYVQAGNVDSVYLLRSAKKKFEEAGFTYVDFSENVEEIVEKSDQRDEEHLSISGAIKFSTYLVDYLGISPKEHSQSVKDDFGNSYSYYVQKYGKFFPKEK